METVADLQSFLSLLQLCDSAFPTGRYAHSYGLEAFAQFGLLERPARPSALFDLLSANVRFSVAPSDGVALACAHRAVEASGATDLSAAREADLRLTALKLPAELRAASKRTGRALLRAASVLVGPGLSDYERLVDDGDCPGNHAVVLGLLSALVGAPSILAVAGELYAFSASWVAAATRLGLVDHLIAQSLIHQVRPVIDDSAVAAATSRLDEMSSCTPLVDVMSMGHEQAEIRLFAS